jgi:hypothetical protein
LHLDHLDHLAASDKFCRLDFHFFQAFLPMILGSLSCHWSHLITCLQTAREPSWI